MKLRRIFCIITAFCIYLTMFSSTIVNSASTIQEKAEVLNSLSILRGYKGDFKLKDKLERCEAAAFIVRILGKEDYVLENHLLYRTTGFPDVVTSEWYAPYIEYCVEQGIINGYEISYLDRRLPDECGRFTPAGLCIGAVGIRTHPPTGPCRCHRVKYLCGSPER